MHLTSYRYQGCKFLRGPLVVQRTLSTAVHLPLPLLPLSPPPLLLLPLTAHRRSALSYEALARERPSGLHATPSTVLRWPCAEQRVDKVT